MKTINVVLCDSLSEGTYSEMRPPPPTTYVRPSSGAVWNYNRKTRDYEVTDLGEQCAYAFKQGRAWLWSANDGCGWCFGWTWTLRDAKDEAADVLDRRSRVIWSCASPARS